MIHPVIENEVVLEGPSATRTINIFRAMKLHAACNRSEIVT